jgi:hypothetical protein
LEERVRNYLILFADAGLDPKPALDHFATKIAEDALEKMVADFEFESSHSAYKFDMMFALTQEASAGAHDCFSAHPLFARTVVRSIGQTDYYPGLPLFVALRECCREATVLGLDHWCVLRFGNLTSEQVAARLEILEYLDWNMLWGSGPRAQISPDLELWKFDTESAQRFLSSTPSTYVEIVESEWIRENCGKLESLMAGQTPRPANTT